MIPPARPPPRYRLYAHRGAAAELPENTLPAFVRALEVGATAIETDCHMTRDGHIVVSHDPTGMRMANAPRAIRDATLAEVRGWDMAWGFVDANGARPFVGQGFRAPTLEEVLAALPPNIPLNVDAKQREPDMTARLVDVVRRAGAASRVTLASFDRATLRRVRRLGYEGPTSMSQAEAVPLVLLPLRTLRALRARSGRSGHASVAQLPHRYGRFDLATPRLIDKCHALGLLVHFWTVNDPERARQLIDRGADGVMTDDPRCVAEALARDPGGVRGYGYGVAR